MDVINLTRQFQDNAQEAPTYLNESITKNSQLRYSASDLTNLKNTSDSTNNAKADSAFQSKTPKLSATKPSHNQSEYQQTTHTNQAGYDYWTHTNTGGDTHYDYDTSSDHSNYTSSGHSNYTTGDHYQYTAHFQGDEHDQSYGHKQDNPHEQGTIGKDHYDYNNHYDYDVHHDMYSHYDYTGPHNQDGTSHYDNDSPSHYDDYTAPQHRNGTNYGHTNNAQGTHHDQAHKNTSQVVPVHTDVATTLHHNVAGPQNFIPIAPQLAGLNKGDTVRDDTFTFGIYSYDRNKGKNIGNAVDKEVYYKVEIRKTGTNPVNWKTVADGPSETYTLNAKDPFNMGWTSPTQSEGDYELRITPYNKQQTLTAPSGYTPASATFDFVGQSATFNFKIQLNRAPVFYADKGTPWIGGTLFADGAIKSNGEKVDYPTLYPNQTSKKGLYVQINVLDNDVNQYLKGKVNLKVKGTNQIIATAPIYWSNNSQIIQSGGKTQTAYAYIPNTELLKLGDRECTLEISVGDYRDSGCTQLAQGTTWEQQIVGNGDTRLMHVNLNSKTLTVAVDPEATESKPIVYRKLPSVTVKANEEQHLKDSFKDMQYVWTKSPTAPSSGWSTSTQRTITTSPKSEDGRWYLHLKVNDKYGKTITKTVGPYILLTDSVKLDGKLNITSTKDEANVSVTFEDKYGVFKNPTIGVKYRISGTNAQYKTMENGSKNFTITGLEAMGLRNGDLEIIPYVKDSTSDLVLEGSSLTLGFSDILKFSIRNQNHFVGSTSRPMNKIHNSSGVTYDGWTRISRLSSDLEDDLRPNQYFYYKYSGGYYSFYRIVYFDDPVGN